MIFTERNIRHVFREMIEELKFIKNMPFYTVEYQNYILNKLEIVRGKLLYDLVFLNKCVIFHFKESSLKTEIESRLHKKGTSSNNFSNIEPENISYNEYTPLSKFSDSINFKNRSISNYPSSSNFSNITPENGSYREYRPLRKFSDSINFKNRSIGNYPSSNKFSNIEPENGGYREYTPLSNFSNMTNIEPEKEGYTQNNPQKWYKDVFGLALNRKYAFNNIFSRKIKYLVNKEYLYYHVKLFLSHTKAHKMFDNRLLFINKDSFFNNKMYYKDDVEVIYNSKIQNKDTNLRNCLVILSIKNKRNCKLQIALGQKKANELMKCGFYGKMRSFESIREIGQRILLINDILYAYLFDMFVSLESQFLSIFNGNMTTVVNPFQVIRNNYHDNWNKYEFNNNNRQVNFCNVFEYFRLCFENSSDCFKNIKNQHFCSNMNGTKEHNLFSEKSMHENIIQNSGSSQKNENEIVKKFKDFDGNNRELMMKYKIKQEKGYLKEENINLYEFPFYGDRESQFEKTKLYKNQKKENDWINSNKNKLETKQEKAVGKVQNINNKSIGLKLYGGKSKGTFNTRNYKNLEVEMYNSYQNDKITFNTTHKKFNEDISGKISHNSIESFTDSTLQSNKKESESNRILCFQEFISQKYSKESEFESSKDNSNFKCEPFLGGLNSEKIIRKPVNISNSADLNKQTFVKNQKDLVNMRGITYDLGKKPCKHNDKIMNIKKSEGLNSIDHSLFTENLQNINNQDLKSKKQSTLSDWEYKEGRNAIQFSGNLSKNDFAQDSSFFSHETAGRKEILDKLPNLEQKSKNNKFKEGLDDSIDEISTSADSPRTQNLNRIFTEKVYTKNDKNSDDDSCSSFGKKEYHVTQTILKNILPRDKLFSNNKDDCFSPLKVEGVVSYRSHTKKHDDRYFNVHHIRFEGCNEPFKENLADLNRKFTNFKTEDNTYFHKPPQFYMDTYDINKIPLVTAHKVDKTSTQEIEGNNKENDTLSEKPEENYSTVNYERYSNCEKFIEPRGILINSNLATAKEENNKIEQMNHETNQPSIFQSGNQNLKTYVSEISNQEKKENIIKKSRKKEMEIQDCDKTNEGCSKINKNCENQKYEEDSISNINNQVEGSFLENNNCLKDSNNHFKIDIGNSIKVNTNKRREYIEELKYRKEIIRNGKNGNPFLNKALFCFDDLDAKTKKSHFEDKLNEHKRELSFKQENMKDKCEFNFIENILNNQENKYEEKNEKYENINGLYENCNGDEKYEKLNEKYKNINRMYENCNGNEKYGKYQNLNEKLNLIKKLENSKEKEFLISPKTTKSYQNNLIKNNPLKEFEINPHSLKKDNLQIHKLNERNNLIIKEIKKESKKNKSLLEKINLENIKENHIKNIKQKVDEIVNIQEYIEYLISIQDEGINNILFKTRENELDCHKSIKQLSITKNRNDRKNRIYKFLICGVGMFIGYHLFKYCVIDKIL